jgi:hypothetical protein
MAYEYLQELSLSEEQQAKLRALGLRSPASLLSRIQFDPQKFSAFFGEQETQRITPLLEAMVPAEEKTQLAQLPPFRGKFGAKIPPPDASGVAAAASQKRDELMARIQMIRQSGASSDKAKAMLEDLEQAYRDQLKSTVSGD